MAGSAYTEPSVRPDNARYGDNPNRLQTHTQFKVILKPEPGDAQDCHLGSLTALGIDLRAHDVRFVEDDWASPALGEWGLGWRRRACSRTRRRSTPTRRRAGSSCASVIWSPGNRTPSRS